MDVIRRAEWLVYEDALVLIALPNDARAAAAREVLGELISAD